MYILFTMASVLVSVISKACEDGLGQINGYSYGGTNLLVFFGVMMAIEAAYQTAYQISQTYMGD
jgi:hypothetical protein